MLYFKDGREEFEKGIGMWTSPAMREFRECGPGTSTISFSHVDYWTSICVYCQMRLPGKEDGLSGPHTSLVSHHASEAEAGLRDTPILVSLMQDLFSTPPPPAEHSGMRHALLRGQNRFLRGYRSHQQLCNLYPQLISTSQSAKRNLGLALG